MQDSTIILFTFFVFIAGIFSVFYIKKQRIILMLPAITSFIATILSVFLGLNLLKNGSFLFFNNNLSLDNFSFYNLCITNVLFLATSVYMIDYFETIDDSDTKKMMYYKKFTALWQAFHALLILVLLSNNIGLTWIAFELTTIVSSFLIFSESETLSIEAMWKYLIVCSVGISLAFIGTILIISAGNQVIDTNSVYLFTELQHSATELNPKIILFAFIFIVVGYGTKAGLAPMHTWLPDAHSQAPTPVSAVFSGVMLNCAIFVIMKYVPIVDCVKGVNGHAHSILLFLGFLSLFVAVIFIPVQYDIKRLLAYCSIEHVGIIVIGFAIGGFGTIAALLHMLNHSVSKVLAFFSAGSIIKVYKTRDMREIAGVSKVIPVWGNSLLISMFVLLGVAPFSTFLSEFFIAKSAFDSYNYFILGLFLLGILSIFIPMLKNVLNIVYGKPSNNITNSIKKVSSLNKLTIILCIVEFILLGLCVPKPFMDFLMKTAQIVEHGLTL